MCTPYKDEYTPLAAESFRENVRCTREGWIRQQTLPARSLLYRRSEPLFPDLLHVLARDPTAYAAFRGTATLLFDIIIVASLP
jgi:hypothetical protein